MDFYQSTAAGTNHVGMCKCSDIFIVEWSFADRSSLVMENGSGGMITDVTFDGGLIGKRIEGIHCQSQLIL